MATTRLERAAGALDPRAGPGPLAEHFELDRAVCFLNHGSFGATPRAVLEVQSAWRARVEREPVRWFVEDLEPELDAARARMAAFVGCPAEDFAFVPNATAGVNAIVRSLRFEPGDQILTSPQEYNACNNVLRHVAERTGAVLVEARVPWPVRSEDELVAAFADAATDRTRLAMVSHITSPTAVRMPVRRITEALARRGIDTLVDGAHAPGYVDLDVAAIGCAYYTGNFHKWACAPKGSAFVYVRPDRQAGVRPAVISHGANSPRDDRSRFRLEFDFAGSMDYSAPLATPAAVDLVASLTGGWEAWRARGARLAAEAVLLVRERLGGEELVPPELAGFMGVADLPGAAGGPTATVGYAEALWERLLTRWGIQVPIIAVPVAGGGSRRHVRLSVAPYNRVEQYAYLADALAAEIGR